MARCPEASSFMNSQEKEKIKVKRIKNQVFIKPLSRAFINMQVSFATRYKVFPNRCSILIL